MADRARHAPFASPDPPAVLVAGMGNVLQRDDALGPYVVRTLAAGWEAPPGVQLRDLGTPGSDLITHLRGAGALVVVDTVRSDEEPGTLLRYHDGRLREPAPGPRTGPHDPGLAETLSTLELLDEAPGEVVLVGVVPGTVRSGLGLSPAVARAVPRAAAAVRSELRRLGRPLRRRAEPDVPDLWWERGSASEAPSRAAPATADPDAG